MSDRSILTSESTVLKSTLSVSIVIISSLVGAIILGAVWVAIGWMRFHGVEPDVVASAIPLESVEYNNAFLNEVGKLIDYYNLCFQGNARFGSGIGLIAGAGLSILKMQRRSIVIKTVAASTAGALVGGRFCLTFTSSPVPVLVSAAFGAVTFALFQIATHETLPALSDRTPQILQDNSVSS